MMRLSAFIWSCWLWDAAEWASRLQTTDDAFILLKWLFAIVAAVAAFASLMWASFSKDT